ncbi:MAG: deoxyribodipyrimidine photo-lyase [Pseudomonadota bacterium]
MKRPILLWFRRDLRLADHEALNEACAAGAPVIPVFICDDIVEGLGAAPQWRLGLGVEDFAKTLSAKGSKLILRKGPALSVLREFVAETGAAAVYWSRAYDPQSIARDKAVKSGLLDDGIEAKSFKGHVLFEPWTIETKTGGFYKVYSPFWRAVAHAELAAPLPAPNTIAAPADWPESDEIAGWGLGARMNRGAGIVADHVIVGEDAAAKRLSAFLRGRIDDYAKLRNFPATPGTSRLSENLTYGEISPRVVWHSAQDGLRRGAPGAETFAKELVWREFAYHLLYHTPHIVTDSWRPEWQSFPWEVGDSEEATAWTRGETGVEIVDAGMRELYVTGYMHNRVRMIVGSYLTKNLMTDWRVGLRWFEDCLIDWDPASNALGWQWVAGSGPDAAPYFRIFNADTQAEKFDKNGVYRTMFLPGVDGTCGPLAQKFYDAVPVSWRLNPARYRKLPHVDLKRGRQRALDAYHAFKEPTV